MPVEENKYDDDKIAEIRKSQDDPLVMYLIVRKSLGMGAGKTAAQCAHAAQMMLLRFFKLKDKPEKTIDMEDFHYVVTTKLWMDESFRKVVLVADDKDWNKIKEEFRCFVVRDAGLTEVDPGSETVIALWPMRKGSAPKLIKRLQTLK